MDRGGRMRRMRKGGVQSSILAWTNTFVTPSTTNLTARDAAAPTVWSALSLPSPRPSSDDPLAGVMAPSPLPRPPFVSPTPCQTAMKFSIGGVPRTDLPLDPPSSIQLTHATLLHRLPPISGPYHDTLPTLTTSAEAEA